MYFIFEDTIVQVMTSFFRDPYIASHCRVQPHRPLIAYNGMELPVGLFPPNGVLPCSFFTRYLGPLAYLSEKPIEVYYIFREIYTKYVCCLHSITSHSQGIVALCKLFEDLVQIYEPDVWFHLQQIGVSPLKVAFPWIFYLFVGYLEVDQILFLYDRIIGFDSLEIVPILAASIFAFRATLILNCNSQEDIDEIFFDMHQLKVIPLIQHFLFATETA